MSAAPVRRGLLVVGLLLLGILALLDLLRHDSFLRNAWGGTRRDRATPAEEVLQQLKRPTGESIRR